MSRRNPDRGRSARPALHQFDTFLRVVETRSFTDVAHQLGVSPSAVAQSIARLEDFFGGELFIRNRRAPLDLTPMGKAILPGARMIVDIVDRQMANAAAVATSRSGSLTLGFYPGVASGPLRDGVADFVAECPDVKLQFVEAPPGTLYRHLNDRIIDVMFSAFVPDTATPTLVREALWREQLHAVFPKGHPAAAKDYCGWADITASPIILRTHQGELAAYRALLQRIGNRPLHCEQHDVSRGVLFEMVALGLGVTISFESALVDRPGVITRPIVDQDSAVAIEAIWFASDANPIRHRLVRHIRERANFTI